MELNSVWEVSRLALVFDDATSLLRCLRLLAKDPKAHPTQAQRAENPLSQGSGFTRSPGFSREAAFARPVSEGGVGGGGGLGGCY